MKLWVLDRVFGARTVDVADAFVVRAECELQARQLASMQAGDEGRDCWTNPEKSTCRPLSEDGESEVIIRDFNAG